MSCVSSPPRSSRGYRASSPILSRSATSSGLESPSLDFVLRFWIQDPENGVTNIRGDAYLRLWDVFKENGVEIPYPHRDVLLRTMPTKDTTLVD